MAFNSLQFILFFLISTLSYYLLPHRFRWALLLFFSCFFYMVFKPEYILILFTTIVVDYWAAIFIEQSEGRRRAHRHATTQAIKEGDRPAAAANPDLDQKEA